MTKVLLTEQQLNEMIEIEKVTNLINKTLSAFGLNIRHFKKLFKMLIGIGITSTLITTSINVNKVLSEQEKNALIEAVENLDDKSNNFNERVNAVESYINYALDKKGFSHDKLRVTPSEFVRLSDKYNYDLPLLLAQCHLESCFGMTPRARKTNSIFSIGSYDNGHNLVYYKTQDSSIEAYIKIMKNDYFSQGRSVDDLLGKGSFINTNGDRYASDRNYEAKLNNVRNRIVTMYPELK